MMQEIFNDLFTMSKLFLSGFFLSITFIVNAAIVQPTELINSPVQIVKQKNNPQPSMPDLYFTATELSDNPAQHLNQKQKLTSNSTQAQNESNHNEELLFSPSPTFDLSQRVNSNQSSRTILKSFARKLENKYADNQLVQQSLSTLYEAKQLWSEADSLANDVADNFFSTLKLDQLIEYDLTGTKKPLQNPVTNDTNSFAQHQQAYDISSYQIRQTQAQINTSSYYYSQLNHDFLDSLFRVTTLYYLVAFYGLFMLLLWAIKFTLRFFP